MEADNTLNQAPKKEKGGVLALILGLMSIFILFGTLGGVAYYYFLIKPSKSTEKLQTAENPQITQNAQNAEIERLVKEVEIKDNEIKVLKEENTLLKQEVSSITDRLSRITKPKIQAIIECDNAPLGKWNPPTQCLQKLDTNLSAFLQSGKKILVLEVSGIVDEKRYAGRSPELKQEGLASFRAKEVMKKLKADFPNLITFEGLSEQKPHKRGFAVRAYYVE